MDSKRNEEGDGAPAGAAGTAVGFRCVRISLIRGDAGQRPALSDETPVNRVARIRLTHELGKIMQDRPEGCQVKNWGDSLFKWVATIPGPQDTPYEGGIFKLMLDFPHNYPHVPPQVCFLTKTYHCNISAAGKLCVDSLERLWVPVLSVANILTAIAYLMANPDPEDPMEEQLAQLYNSSRQTYDLNARMWTLLYAHSDDAAIPAAHLRLHFNRLTKI